MSWEEKLLFLMFLDYKGALKKWERNHDKCSLGTVKIDDFGFCDSSGFVWNFSPEGHFYWENLTKSWRKALLRDLKVRSLDYKIRYRACKDSLEVGCQTITKKDALGIADFIYECFGEEV